MALATLSIDLVARLAEFEKNMREASTISEKTATAIKKRLEDVRGSALDMAKAAAIGYAGISSVSALKGMITSSIESAAALKDLSQQTGATVEGLSALGGIGKMSGTGLDTIGAAMNKLSKSMSTADEDSRGTATALKAIGISVEDFRSQKPDEQMLTVAKALDQFKDGADKSAVAMALFGKSGAEMLPFLSDVAEAGALNGKVSTEQAEAADRFGDNLVKLQNSGKGWEKQLAFGILPALDETTQAVKLLFDGSGGLKDQMKKLADDGSLADFARGGVTAISYMVDGVIVLKRAFELTGAGIYGALKTIGYSIEGVANAAGKLKTGDFAGAGESLSAGFHMAGESIEEFTDKVKEGFSEAILGSQLRTNIANIREVGKAADETKKKLVFNDAGTPKKNPEIDRALAEYEKLITKIREKTDVTRQEIDTNKDLTEAQKMASNITAQLRDGRLHLGAAQKKSVAGYLEELLAIDQLNEARKRDNKWLEESTQATDAATESEYKRLETIREALKTTQEQNEQFGLSIEAIDSLKRARQIDTAAELERRAAAMEGLPGYEHMTEVWREQASALRALALEQDQAASNRWLADAAKASEEAMTAEDQRLATIREALKTQREQNEAFGLSAEELASLQRARQLDTAAALEQRAAAMDGLPGYEQMVEVWREQASALRDLSDAQDTAAQNQDRERRDPTAGAIRGVKNYLHEIESAGDATAAVVQRGMSGIEDALTTLVTTGNVDIRQFVNGMIAEFMRMAIIKPMMASLMTAVGGGFGGGARAGGGPVKAGQVYLVGENGPEYVLFGADGGVVPAAQTSQLMQQHAADMQRPTTSARAALSAAHPIGQASAPAAASTHTHSSQTSQSSKVSEMIERLISPAAMPAAASTHTQSSQISQTSKLVERFIGQQARFVGGRASGGLVAGGSAALVGENGPELALFGADARVLPAAQSASMAGNTALQQHITVHIDARTDQAAVAELVAKGVRQGNEALVRDLKARGKL